MRTGTRGSATSRCNESHESFHLQFTKRTFTPSADLSKIFAPCLPVFSDVQLMNSTRPFGPSSRTAPTDIPAQPCIDRSVKSADDMPGFPIRETQFSKRRDTGSLFDVSGLR